jgi:CBS-domain-containing membrane protein
MARLRVGYLFRRSGNAGLWAALYVLTAGTVSLGTITLAAYLTGLPLLFPPLAPSAFVLFHAPMSQGSSPRNVLLSHTTALAAGLASLHASDRMFPGAGLLEPSVVGGPRIVAITLAVGLVSTLMIAFRYAHAPAAATALLAAMGFFENSVQMLGLIAAILLLVGEAFLFNRVLGGLPYPAWRSDPTVSRRYGALAGIPSEAGGYWRELSSRIIRGRRAQ